MRLSLRDRIDFYDLLYDVLVIGILFSQCQPESLDWPVAITTPPKGVPCPGVSRQGEALCCSLDAFLPPLPVSLCVSYLYSYFWWWALIEFPTNVMFPMCLSRFSPISNLLLHASQRCSFRVTVSDSICPYSFSFMPISPFPPRDIIKKNVVTLTFCVPITQMN
jgi:hypothetical protein